MKKIYKAPALEIEVYELNASIASNCAVVVTMGDYGGGEGERACDDYLAMVGKSTNYSLPHNVDFWESTCDCYITASGEGFFTS